MWNTPNSLPCCFDTSKHPAHFCGILVLQPGNTQFWCKSAHEDAPGATTGTPVDPQDPLNLRAGEHAAVAPARGVPTARV